MSQVSISSYIGSFQRSCNKFCFVFHLKRIRLMDYRFGSGGLVFKRSQILRVPCIILANN